MLPGHYGSYSFPCSTPPAHVAQHLAERAHHECRRGGDRRYWHCAHPCPHLYTGTGLTAATSAPGLGSPLPPLRQDWAHPCHLCAGTGLTPAISAPGLGSPLPHRIHRALRTAIVMGVAVRRTRAPAHCVCACAMHATPSFSPQYTGSGAACGTHAVRHHSAQHSAGSRPTDVLPLALGRQQPSLMRC